ncbi:eukaryotic aspartyl protease [Colletotrichum tofieldiae]|uniref:Eukaryotic aspartyl protease n=1 Tax=Colletotrichum tofieldiae TaxID=708197 RepID=A0A166XCJ7_9PEZI|nr:eukaryotic aspartyl protease [Colletotrichum tofieldiae]GKT66530.1 eukaryotic aspartyl protease [Colletotrichum tofieldiae]GKT71598.1 eukaryotic aspartyl protease [Colletotrichum tofieldiae]
MAARLLPLAALAASVSALSVAREETNSSPGVLSLPVYQDVRLHPLEKLRRRQVSDTDAPVLNVTSTTYLIELNIGTPGQDTKVAIDTGSSELWVNPNCANAGSTAQTQSCRSNGQYDPQDSSTSSVYRQTGRIKYGKGEVILQYVSDNITIPGSDISLVDTVFGYATDSVDLNRGILGLSFGQAVNNTGYPTVVDEMKAQNIIESLTMGIALGTKDEKTGSGLISFGGVDTKKFSGNLHTAPILGPQNGENLFRYWVQLDSIGLSKSGSSAKTYSNSKFPVFFDTGATLSYLPPAVVDQLGSDLGGRLDSSVNMYVVPCNTQGTIDFKFGDYTMKVPLSEFIWQVSSRDCVLGADKATDGSYLLGDSFLRSTYVVFDQETPALHFAPYVNCGSNLKKIPLGDNAAAKFSGECQAGSSNSGGSGGGSNSGNNENAAGRVTSSNMWMAAGALLAVQVFMSFL